MCVVQKKINTLKEDEKNRIRVYVEIYYTRSHSIPVFALRAIAVVYHFAI